MEHRSIQDMKNGPPDKATIRQLSGMGIITRAWEEGMPDWVGSHRFRLRSPASARRPVPLSPVPAARAFPSPGHANLNENQIATQNTK